MSSSSSTIRRRTRRRHQHTRRVLAKVVMTTHKQDPGCPIGLTAFETKRKAVSMHQHQQSKKEFVKLLMTKYAKGTVKPTHDFYSYINDSWLKHLTIQDKDKYLIQIDDFRLTQHQVYEDLHALLLTYIRTHKSNPLAKRLHAYYTSVIRMNALSHSKQLAAEVVPWIDAQLAQPDNMWGLLAHMCKDEMLAPHCPFVWTVEPDDKNPQIFRCYVNAHSFVFSDISVYYDDGTEVAYKRKYRAAFRTYCQTLFDTCLGPHHGFDVGDVFVVEQQMFTALGCERVTRRNESAYNKVAASTCVSKYRFDWPQFATALGFRTVPSFFITSSLNYLQCGTDLMSMHWNSRAWRTYWTWMLLRRLARITRAWEHITFSFYGEFERGQEQIVQSNAVSAILYMTTPFNTFFTNQYVEHFEDPRRMRYVETLCTDLKQVFLGIMARNTWLSPKTKKYALYKLSKLSFTIGKPDRLREDAPLPYVSTSLYDNLQMLYAWRHQQFLSLEGNPVIDIPMVDWTQYPVKLTGTQAYIVNAAYTPSKNNIYINLGYIQPPFVDLHERGIEYNLAHIGFTIGHEMSHSMDDWGSQYDAQGRLSNWWTSKDKAHFAHLQKDIVTQYEVYAKRDGIVYDASLSIGEDLADISGLAICDQYLHDFQEHNQDLTPIRSLSYDMFYVFFAMQEKEYVGKKSLSVELKTNPHPLNKYRCNIPLSRSLLFRALFNVKPGDGMFWHSDSTVW